MIHEPSIPRIGLGAQLPYLWNDEFNAGADSGRKDRPSAIVLTEMINAVGAIEVTVLPITHSPPLDPAHAVQIPPAVKQHMGLDSAHSWIIVSECNDFVWPGFDLRKRSKSSRYNFGFLPPLFFDRVREAFLAL